MRVQTFMCQDPRRAQFVVEKARAIGALDPDFMRHSNLKGRSLQQTYYNPKQAAYLRKNVDRTQIINVRASLMFACTAQLQLRDAELPLFSLSCLVCRDLFFHA